MEKLLGIALVFCLVLVGGCFSSQKQADEKAVQGDNVKVEQMAKAFSGIDMTNAEVRDLIISKSTKRGIVADDVYVSGIVSENIVKREMDKSTENLALMGKYKNNLVFSTNRRYVDYDLNKAEVVYGVTLVGENNEIVVNGLITVIYTWNGSEWKQSSVTFTEEAAAVNSDAKRGSNGFPASSPFTRNLYYIASNYMNGNDVKVMQTRLNEFFAEHNISYNLGTPDGYFGPNTRGAVIKFQQCYTSLAADGVFGPMTGTVLWDKTDGTTGSGSVLPAAYSYKIDVKIYSDRWREGKLYLYNKSLANIRVTRAIGRSVSNGSQFVNSGNTPTGTYDGSLGPRVTDNQMSYGPGNVIQLVGIAGNAKTAYNTYGRSGIWIHGGRGVDEGYTSGVLYATHGCVRIPDADQKAMFGTSNSSRGMLGNLGVSMWGKGLVNVIEQ